VTSVGGRDVEVSSRVRLSDALYDEIADALISEADRIRSLGSSSSTTSLKRPKGR